VTYGTIDDVKRIAGIELTEDAYDTSLTLSLEFAGRYAEAYISPYISTLTAETLTVRDWVFNTIPLSTYPLNFVDAVALIAAEDHFRRYQVKPKPDRNYEAEGIAVLDMIIKIYWKKAQIIVAVDTADNAWED